MVHGGIDDARASVSSIPCNGAASCSGGGCQCQRPGGGDFMIDEFEDSQRQHRRGRRRRVGAMLVQVRAGGLLAVRDHGHRRPAAGRPLAQQGIVAGRAARTSATPPGHRWHRAGHARLQPAGQRHLVHVREHLRRQREQRTIWTSAASSRRRPRTRWRPRPLVHVHRRASACIDPMSYRGDCGGQRFFRNDNRDLRRVRGAAVQVRRDQNSHLSAAQRFRPGHADHARRRARESISRPRRHGHQRHHRVRDGVRAARHRSHRALAQRLQVGERARARRGAPTANPRRSIR